MDGIILTPLHDAILDKNVDLALDLITDEVDVNAKEAFRGNTPLHLIVQNACETKPQGYDDNLFLVKILTDAGANVNSVNFVGRTPLHDAISSHTIRLIQHLLACGADVNQSDASHNSPLHEVARQMRSTDEDEAELLNVARLLLEHKANVNAQSRRGFTPLHLLAQSNSVDAVELFLEHEADVNIRDNSGDTAVNIASRCGNFEVLRLLVRNGAELNSTNPMNGSPLHWACSRNEIKIVKFLLKNGANIDAVDSAGCTPLNRSLKASQTSVHDLKEKREKTLVLLLKNWPDVNTIDFTGNNILKIDSDRNCRRIIIEHLAKMEMRNLPINPSLLLTISQLYYYYFTDSGMYDISYFTECKDELLLARMIQLDDSDVNFFDLLVDDESKLVNYARNGGLVECFENSDYEEIFPIYGPTIKKNMTKALKRRRLYDDAAVALTQCLPIVVGPDHLVIQGILFFLDKKDLKNLSEIDYD